MTDGLISSPDDLGEPPAFDSSTAHIARVYDYWLGGKDNFAADREAGDEAYVAYPDIRATRKVVFAGQRAFSLRASLRGAGLFMAADGSAALFLRHGE